MDTLRYTIEGICDKPAPKNTVQAMKLFVEPILEGLGWLIDGSSVEFDDHNGRPLVRLRGALPTAAAADTRFGELTSRARRFAALEVIAPADNLETGPIAVPSEGPRLDIFVRTNGHLWSVFVPRYESVHRCDGVDIRQSAKRSANLLRKYLQVENLSEGRARMAGEGQLEPSEEMVRRIWHRMQEQLVPQLIQCVQEFYEQELGRRPTEELIGRVLKGQPSNRTAAGQGPGRGTARNRQRKSRRKVT